jgi:predicted alpha/beta-hydrolase family hydrolase
MKTDRVKIPVGDETSVSGMVVLPDEYDGKHAIIFAHGAGNNMNQSMIVFLAEEMARAGYLTLRFNFPYKEQGKNAPDRPEVLYRTWEAACQFLHSHQDYHAEHIVAAGKSMGGRIASQMVAEGKLPVWRLIFLGYPLHPAGKKDKLRDQHLHDIRVPMLFFAGTRDQLCDLDLLKGILSRLSTPWHLEVIEGGDHSFNVLKAARVSLEEICGRICWRA